jgi:hypothetical protein
MSRVIRQPLGPNAEGSFSSPEDVILNKLVYYREGQSEKHLRDIASMLKIQGDKLDLAYTDHWAHRLDLTDEWRVVRNRAGGSPNV